MPIIREIKVPQMDVGTPFPCLLVDDADVVLIYDSQIERSESLKPVGFRFHRVTHIEFGYPNDEGLHSHPLYEAGLEWYAAFEVSDSPLIERLIAMLRVTWEDRRDFSDLRHFIWTFKENTFEIVCRGYELLSDSESGRLSALSREALAGPRKYQRTFVDPKDLAD